MIGWNRLTEDDKIKIIAFIGLVKRRTLKTMDRNDLRDLEKLTYWHMDNSARFENFVPTELITKIEKAEIVRATRIEKARLKNAEQAEWKI